MSPADQKRLARRIVNSQIALNGDDVFRALANDGDDVFRALANAANGTATPEMVTLLCRLPLPPEPDCAVIPRTRTNLRNDRVHAMACALVAGQSANLVFPQMAAKLAIDMVDAVDAALEGA